MKAALIGLAILALQPLTPAAAADTRKEISFGILSTESSQNLKQDWQPILADMSQRTGHRVNAYFAPDYSGMIEAMRFGKVQVAWLGNKPGIEAVDRAGGEVFAQVIPKGGVAGYWSLLIVHRDSTIQTVEDVVRNAKGITMGLGDPNSTSGFLVPGYFLFAMNKLNPRTHFKAARNANHEANFLSVLSRQVDAATVSSEILDRYEQKEPQKVKDVRVVWRSPLIASDPLLWRKDLDSETKRLVREFFFAYGTRGADVARERQQLSKLLAEGFKESSDKQLIPYRQMELYRDRSKLEDDKTTSPAERSSKLSELDRKLSELDKQL